MSYRKDKQERFDWTMKRIDEIRNIRKRPVKQPITFWTTNKLCVFAVVVSNLVCVWIVSLLVYLRHYFHA